MITDNATVTEYGYILPDVTKIKYNVSIAQDMSHIIDFRTNTTLVEQIRVDGTEKQPGELERLTIQPKIFTNGLIWVGTVTFYDLWQVNKFLIKLRHNLH